MIPPSITSRASDGHLGRCHRRGIAPQPERFGRRRGGRDARCGSRGARRRKRPAFDRHRDHESHGRSDVRAAGDLDLSFAVPTTRVEVEPGAPEPAIGTIDVHAGRNRDVNRARPRQHTRDLGQDLALR